MALDRTNQEIIEFNNSSITNKLFSFLVKKQFRCPKNHLSSHTSTSLGFILGKPQEDESLIDLIKKHFSEKISTNHCQQCRYVNRDHGMDWIEVVDYPKYLILFIDSFDKDGSFSSPLSNIPQKVNLLEFSDKPFNKKDKSMTYDLTAILSHDRTSSNKESMYTAVVRKHMDRYIQKQWVTFNKDKWKRIKKEEARNNYPA